MQPKKKKEKLLKKKVAGIFQHSGFRNEPWSPIDLVHTPTPPLTSPGSLGKPYLLLSIMPFKLVSTSWSFIRINGDNARKKNFFRQRPEEDKCLTDVCNFTFSYCEATTREPSQAKPSTGLCSEGLSLIQREVWTLPQFPGSSSLNP